MQQWNMKLHHHPRVCVWPHKRCDTLTHRLLVSREWLWVWFSANHAVWVVDELRWWNLDVNGIYLLHKNIFTALPNPHTHYYMYTNLIDIIPPIEMYIKHMLNCFWFPRIWPNGARLKWYPKWNKQTTSRHTNGKLPHNILRCGDDWVILYAKLLGFCFVFLHGACGFWLNSIWWRNTQHNSAHTSYDGDGGVVAPEMMVFSSQFFRGHSGHQAHMFRE